jgi:hypothetical protein
MKSVARHVLEKKKKKNYPALERFENIPLPWNAGFQKNQFNFRE